MNHSLKAVLGIVAIALLAILAISLVSRSPPDTVPIDSLLVNGTFNESGEAWQTHSSWPVAWTSAEGDGAMQVTAISERGAMERGVLSQCINLQDGRQFALGGRFKQDERSTRVGRGQLRIAWFDRQSCAGSGAIDTAFASPEQLSGWQQLRVDTLTAPAFAQSALISINQSVEGAGNYIGYWDDLYLRPTNGQ